MTAITSQIVRALAWALVLAIVAQLYLAGALVFGALGPDAHRILGVLILLASLVTALASLTSRRTRALSRGFLAIVGVVLLQGLLVMVRPRFPAVSALHSVNAVVLLGMSYRMARRAAATHSHRNTSLPNVAFDAIAS